MAYSVAYSRATSSLMPLQYARDSSLNSTRAASNFRIRLRIQQTLPSWRLDPQSFGVRLRLPPIRVAILWRQVRSVSCEYFLSRVLALRAMSNRDRCPFLADILEILLGPVVSRNCLPIRMIEVCNSAHCVPAMFEGHSSVLLVA